MPETELVEKNVALEAIRKTVSNSLESVADRIKTDSEIRSKIETRNHVPEWIDEQWQRSPNRPHSKSDYANKQTKRTVEIAQEKPNEAVLNYRTRVPLSVDIDLPEYKDKMGNSLVDTLARCLVDPDQKVVTISRQIVNLNAQIDTPAIQIRKKTLTWDEIRANPQLLTDVVIEIAGIKEDTPEVK